MNKIKLPKILKQILLILSILIFDQVNSYAGDCPLTINSPLTSGCFVQSSGLEITSGGSLIIPSGSSFNLQITRVVTGSIINSGEIHGLNSQVLIQKNINGGFTNTLTGNIHGNRPFNIEDYSTVNSFSNAGFIGTAATTINHYGGVIDLWGGGGILNGAHITGGFTNSGDIKAVLSADGFLDGSGNRRDASGIRLVFSTDSITGGIYNSGTIASASGDGIQNGGLIDSITNTGTITGSGYGISNYNFLGTNIGTIGTLNNSQGALSSSLTYQGNLPTNYNIVINGISNYGKLAVTNGLGNMAFNIYGYAGQTLTSGVQASSVTNNHRYQNVLTGLVGTLSGSIITGTGFSIAGATGNYGVNNYSYSLVADDGNVAGTWDLLFGSLGPSGPTTADTQASMAPNAYALRGAYSLQSAIINTGLSYDCTTFDKNGICVSAGGRVTDTNNPSANSQGALLIASYRANEQWRVGAYLDQNLSSNDARGVNLDNNNPMGGVFAVWNQNTDGTGYQVRLASGYSDKDVTISRSAFGATGEAGKGDSSLQSQAYSATLSRGFQLNNTRWIASPYLGVRYNKIKRTGYTEDNSADVTAPLTYSALSQETTTALVGVRFNGQLGDKINLMASAGIENDIAHNTGDYAATGVDGLTPISFNQNIRHIRPVASAGASYAIDKRQTVGANLNFRQEAFNSTNSVSGMVTYQVGF